jgi:endonuclease/exonuclease/phosphatase (EEP) superfamily protein YafD
MEQAKARRLARFFQRLVSACAWAYLAVLVALCGALAVVGEKHWLTTLLLYVPRVIYALPLLVLTPALWLCRARRLWWTQAAAALLVLFPLMGLVMPWPAPSARGPTLKLLSFNIDTARRGPEGLLAVVDRERPDLVLFQETPWAGPVHAGLRARYPYVEPSTDFLLASRFAVLERTPPDRVPATDPRSRRFVRYLVDTSLGKLAVYSVHPISPRGTLNANTFRGVIAQIRAGALLESAARRELLENAQLRVNQVGGAANLARVEPYPVLLAGDTNLPSLSPALRRQLGAYHDAFRSAGWGFGYTFPAEHPFLRLDRVLLGPELAASEFRVGCPGASDHLCVVAQLFRR